VEKTSVARHSRPLRCSRIRGVRNLGSTCFLSTVIQTFLHNPLLRAHFLSGSHIPRGERECPVVKDRGVCFGCEVDTLFGQVWGPGSPEKRTDRPGGYVVPNRPSLPLPLSLSPSPYDPLPSENGGGDGGEAIDGGVVPTGIIWTLWGAGLRDGLASTASSTVLAGYAQQDAHEFFIAALDMLHASSPGMREDGRCGCIVHRTFAGSLSSQVRCEGCGNVTRTLDPILDLSLEVPLLDKARSSSLSLPECIEKYTLPERLRGTNYTCGSCGDSTQVGLFYFLFTSLPVVLVLVSYTCTHSGNPHHRRYPSACPSPPSLPSSISS
jgi:ubiquitin carboxyl-terminal hydrolase 22/27/51